MTSAQTDYSEIDQVALQQIRDFQRPGKESVVLRLIDAYLSSSTPLVDDLGRALDDDDEQTVQRSAHTLKSSSMVLGASEFAALCKQIEGHTREGNLAEVRPLMSRFSALYESTCASLLSLREQEI